MFDDVTHPKVKIYPQTKFLLIHDWDITTSGLEKKTSAILEFFFPLRFYQVPLICVLFLMKFPDFVQIGPPAATVWPLIDFQDNSRGGSILLPVLYLMMSLYSEGQRPSANQISSTNLKHGWDITTSGLEKPSAIFKFYFRFRFRPYRCTRCVILHQSAKFYPNRTTYDRKLRHVVFQDGGSLPSWIFMGPIMGSLKSPCMTSYGSSMETTADKQMDRPVALSRSHCRERRINKRRIERPAVQKPRAENFCWIQIHTTVCISLWI